jgi:hypothetical protein
LIDSTAQSPRKSCDISLDAPASSVSQEAKQLALGSAVTSIAPEQPKPKDVWDKVDIIGKLLGSILIPFGIAAVGYFVNLTLQERAAEQKAAEIAITVLQSANTSTPKLKEWAQGVFEKMLATANQKLSPGARKELDHNPLPSTPTLSLSDFVRKRFTPSEFRDYIAGIDFSGWQPQFAVAGSAGISIARWHEGATDTKINGLMSFYGDMKWSGGTHLVIDDEGTWGLNPLSRKGICSPSWNASGICITMIGTTIQNPSTPK